LKKKDILKNPVEHIDIKRINTIPIIDQYAKTAIQAKNLARAARIYDHMLRDTDCMIILCLAGSLFSAGLKKIVADMVALNMVDVIVSTGAIMVDQDFFEALGFHHYQGTAYVDDDDLMRRKIDRIYDTYIDEDELRICDMTVKEIADELKPGVYSSRQFIQHMGRYLSKNDLGRGSVVRTAYHLNVPIFVPTFSDSSAGFGLVSHQWENRQENRVAIDSVRDLYELTQLKIASKDTGLFIVGGGVPKNFAQDVTVAADILGNKVSMHKYALQITVADERDGGLSGSTLKEAHSWGKVDKGQEQIVFSEATIAMPLIVSYGYHKTNWRERDQRKLNNYLDQEETIL
jgi:deoxyhypusine synthase